MATQNKEIKSYDTFNINKYLVKDDSPINDFDEMDNLAFDARFEGVPTEKLILGGIKVKKTSYTDVNDGVWIGIDKDGKAKINIGNENEFLLWNGEKLIISGELEAATITGGTIQTATTGLRILMSSTNANRIEFLNDDTTYGLLEVTDDSGDSVVRLVSPQSGNHGLYLRSNITGSFAENTRANLESQGAFVSAGGSGNNYNSQIGVDNVSFGVYRDGGGNRFIGISSGLYFAQELTPKDSNQHNLGQLNRRWDNLFLNKDVFCRDVDVENVLASNRLEGNQVDVNSIRLNGQTITSWSQISNYL